MICTCLFQVLSVRWQTDHTYAWWVTHGRWPCHGVAAIHGLTVPSGLEDSAHDFAAKFCNLRSVSAPA